MAEILQDRLVVTSDTKYLMLVRDFLSRFIRRSALPAEEENKIVLAVDEAVSNIIEHAYQGEEAGSIEIEVDTDGARFRIVIRDTGRKFDPDHVKDPDIPAHVAAGRKRGLGIFLMRQIMDEVKYSFRDGVKNELTLVRYIH